MPVLVVVSALAFAAPASAVLTNIQQGNTVFLGESGLVLAPNVFYTSGGVVDDQLAYFSGSNPATDSPQYVFAPSKNSFYVDSPTFSDRLGQWYSYPNGSKNNHVAINVNKPSLGLRLWAYRAGGNSFDITNGKIVQGEALDFRIDSNLYPIFQRTGVTASDGGVDIRVKNQVGATLTALYDCSGTAVSIVNIHPNIQQFFLPSGTVACVWDTGNSEYKTGSYTVWAECNVNGMMDNLGAIEGETITPTLGTLRSTPTQTSTPVATTAIATTSTTVATPVQTSTPDRTAEPVETESAVPTVTGTPVQTSATPAVSSTVTGMATLPQTPLSAVTIILSLAIAALMLAVIPGKKKE